VELKRARLVFLVCSFLGLEYVQLTCGEELMGGLIRLGVSAILRALREIIIGET